MSDQNNTPERIWVVTWPGNPDAGIWQKNYPGDGQGAMEFARADRAAPEGQVMAQMRSAFSVIEARGPRHFAMVFKFQSLDELQAADKEWRAAVALASREAQPACQQGAVTKAMVDAAFNALPPDAHGTIGSGEMERVLGAALRALKGENNADHT